MKKKVLFCFLAVLFGVLAAHGLLAYAATEGIYTYSVSAGKATITDCSSSASGSITIPS